jgi:hypothetical protein
VIIIETMFPNKAPSSPLEKPSFDNTRSIYIEVKTINKADIPIFSDRRSYTG